MGQSPVRAATAHASRRAPHGGCRPSTVGSDSPDHDPSGPCQITVEQRPAGAHDERVADDASRHAPATRLLEIACDESGYEGERLIGSTTDVFAHASLCLDERTAADCVQELRRRIRSPATEYKANHLLREKHRSTLEWLLGPQAPVLGHANVLLIDKAYYVLRHLAQLLEPGAGAGACADALYRDGPRILGARRWHAVLAGANDLLRS